MTLKIDNYTKFVLTLIAIALLLNAAVGFMNMNARNSTVFASSATEMKITDIHTTWPLKVEITKWPEEVKMRK